MKAAIAGPNAGQLVRSQHRRKHKQIQKPLVRSERPQVVRGITQTGRRVENAVTWCRHVRAVLRSLAGARIVIARRATAQTGRSVQRITDIVEAFVAEAFDQEPGLVMAAQIDPLQCARTIGVVEESQVLGDHVDLPLLGRRNQYYPASLLAGVPDQLYEELISGSSTL